MLPAMDAKTIIGRMPAIRSRRFALFQFGFRPFFLLAGIHALVSIPLWLWIHMHAVAPLSMLPPQYWHGHEMIYGFVCAAIAGFLLTAVPSWTGSRGFGGRPLIVLSALWLAGRAAFAAGEVLPTWALATIELSFLPALAILLAPPLVRARNRNTPMLIVLGVLWVIDAAFIAGLIHGDPLLAQRALHAALNLILILVTVIGGRIVPSFTANALRARGETVGMATRPWFDKGLVFTMVAVVIVDAAGVDPVASGVLAVVASLAHAWRLAGWQGFKTRREPILWALHIGYAWLPIGFALKALWLLGGVSWAFNWVHAFTMGVFGTMILAVMTRASLGHTGRPLVISRSIAVAYVVLTVAVVVRVWGALLDVLGYVHALTCAGALWTIAFALYLLVYTPILIRPRADGKPG
jgi:uncharacterized protein involved in response to NO